MSKETGVPILISIDDNEDIVDTFVEYLQKDLGYDNEKVMVQLSTRKLIEDSNFTLIITQFSRGLNSFKSSIKQNYQIRDNRYDIYNFLKQLDINCSLASRILLSTNVSFKSQMMQYGGDGYSSIYEFLTNHMYLEPLEQSISKFTVSP